MKKFIINVPEDIKYISDWEGYSLPNKKCIINKTVTGCGFTEYCLRNNLPTILCSPRKILLSNKYGQHLDDNIFLVSNSLNKNSDIFYDDTKQGYLNLNESSSDPTEVLNLIDSIKEYVINSNLGTTYIPKILVTYDSLKHVLKALESLGDQYFNLFYFIIDEFQSIFTDSYFKASVEMDLVEYLKDLNNVVYLSATPMLDKYLEQMEEFKDLDYYEFKWPKFKIIKPKITRIKTKSINKSIEKIIGNYLEGNFPKKVTPDRVLHESKEVVFYVNSVVTICSVIKKMELKPSQVNIICSDNKKNASKLRKVKHKIGEIPKKGEPHKMFTFCTRTTYLGADFYSTCASTVICSDCNISSLCLDISLDLPQIMGRQRLDENVFKDEAIVYYRSLNDFYSDQEFNSFVEKKLRDTDGIIHILDIINTSYEKALFVDQVRTTISVKKYSNNYAGISEKTGLLILNNLVFLAEQRAFEVQQKIYRDDISIYRELSKVSLSSSDHSQEIIDFLGEFNKITLFQNSFRFFCEYNFSSEDVKRLVVSELPQNIQNYYYLLGPDKCRAVGYQKSRLEKASELLLNVDNTNNIISTKLLECFSISCRYSLKEIKEKIKEIYDNLGIPKTPKASDLRICFIVKKCTINYPDGRRENGFEILGIK